MLFNNQLHPDILSIFSSKHVESSCSNPLN
uniref:Uncharacterized protein n=1 Tax=Arundo donax TaxID=35708 RepID=A0A0A9HK01_ARUDO